jgi:peroxiredoxin
MNATKAWMRAGFIAAAVFYAVSGVFLIGWPALPLSWYGVAVFGAALPLIQFAGIVDLGLAAGLASASIKPCQAWPVALAGFVLHAGVVLEFVAYERAGGIPWSAWPVAAVHDALWTLPLGAILYGVHREYAKKRGMGCREVQTFALRAKTQYGVSVLEMSSHTPVLMVFLRQIGCTFCREALADLAAHRREIDSQGVQIAIVHMGCGDQVEPFLDHYGLSDLPRISDANQSLYRAFGLRRGSFGQLFGPKVWLRGLTCGRKYGNGKTLGDSAQMPGAFLVFHGEVLKSYKHQSAADRADFVALVAQQDYPIAS